MGKKAEQDMKNAIAAMVRALRESQIEVPPKPTARKRAFTVEWEKGVTDQATRALELAPGRVTDTNKRVLEANLTRYESACRLSEFIAGQKVARPPL